MIACHSLIQQLAQDLDSMSSGISLSFGIAIGMKYLLTNRGLMALYDIKAVMGTRLNPLLHGGNVPYL
jgi:hypothetical protein